MGQKNDPHYGEDTSHQPHMGEREEPEGGGKKPTSTGPTEETGTDIDDANEAGMRPTGSGGSAPRTENPNT